MAKKKRRVRVGAEILYRALDVCEVRDGVLVIALRSGDHVEFLPMPVRLGMELQDRLTEELSALADFHCLACERRRKD